MNSHAKASTERILDLPLQSFWKLHEIQKTIQAIYNTPPPRVCNALANHDV
jgi:hypothetical protein